MESSRTDPLLMQHATPANTIMKESRYPSTATRSLKEFRDHRKLSRSVQIIPARHDYAACNKQHSRTKNKCHLIKKNICPDTPRFRVTYTCNEAWIQIHIETARSCQQNIQIYHARALGDSAMVPGFFTLCTGSAHTTRSASHHKLLHTNKKGQTRHKKTHPKRKSRNRQYTSQCLFLDLQVAQWACKH